ncbi:MaoC/PaaZ C-terminal domain-containing protein [Actinoplanes utahensis]|uniref:MaoC-like domain-containing protein n=1 Tax=Actinoplanes utahensis TaxID=1869 RepID=A0A0A6X995_ACTUT|nr:MaoC/PaaZ C-terminal domain-containing protein [Actinoplanes utahensis]KHD76692.1 hypothetical protein MB27_15500 [Actinoplanes utahensis]GIF33251.1 hypothetical protein Aut01nite_62370 [Actinoplanes utahensis]
MVAVVELSSGPGTTAAYARAALGLLPGLRRGGPLPDVEVLHRGVTVDRGHLAAYDRVCGFRLTDTLPATYPQVLAFPLTMRLLTAPDFPLPLIGLVHIANRITVRHPIPSGATLDISIRALNLRDHPRGRQFDVLTTVSFDGAEAWRSTATYLRLGPGPAPESPGDIPSAASPPGITSAAASEPGTNPPGGTPAGVIPSGVTPPGATPSGATPSGVIPPGATPSGVTPPGAARRGAAPSPGYGPGAASSAAPSSPGTLPAHPSPGADGSRTTGGHEMVASPATGSVWRVPARVGTDYAAVSGDRNPIHTSRLGARLFGYPRPIAHGMWTKARALAALEGRLPDTSTIDVTFKKPLLLPCRAEFHATRTPSGWDFSVHSAHPHLTGSIVAI